MTSAPLNLNEACLLDFLHSDRPLGAAMSAEAAASARARATFPGVASDPRHAHRLVTPPFPKRVPDDSP